MTTQPERVLSPKQTAEFHRLIAHLTEARVERTTPPRQLTLAQRIRELLQRRLH